MYRAPKTTIMMRKQREANQAPIIYVRRIHFLYRLYMYTSVEEIRLYINFIITSYIRYIIYFFSTVSPSLTTSPLTPPLSPRHLLHITSRVVYLRESWVHLHVLVCRGGGLSGLLVEPQVSLGGAKVKLVYCLLSTVYCLPAAAPLAVWYPGLDTQLSFHERDFPAEKWSSDDQVMIKWWSSDDQVMIKWWSSDDQLMIKW